MGSRAAVSERVEQTPIAVGLLGLGVVGSRVAHTLLEKGKGYGRSAGAPLALRRVLVRDAEKRRPLELAPGLLTTNPEEVLADPEIAIVVEVMGGEQPAHDYIRRALASGRHVVTANKEVIAKHGPELLSLAHNRGVGLFFEASVGSGIPLIAPLRRDLLANEITCLKAIINGTTNYILTCMSREGLDFESALAQAQQLGYAEPDPANDIQGIDAAYKLAILASLAFHAPIPPQAVYREGIERLAPRDFRYAQELGYTIKLLALGRREGAQVQVRVHPVLLPQEELLAKVDGVLNAVQIEGDLLGPVLFQGPGAGPLPTTSAIIADVLEAARSIIHGPSARPLDLAEEVSVTPISQLVTRYYLRLTVADRPGVLAQIANILGDMGISIASVIQKEAHESQQTAEIVIMTHPAQEAAMGEALALLKTLAVVVEVGNLLRVEG